MATGNQNITVHKSQICIQMKYIGKLQSFRFLVIVYYFPKYKRKVICIQICAPYSVVAIGEQIWFKQVDVDDVQQLERKQYFGST